MMNILNVRDLLNRNKIFFETITASALSIMALIVSFGQLSIVSKQTELLRLQTKVTIAQASPHIYAQVEKQIDPLDHYQSFDSITVENRGGVISEYSSTTAVFLHIEYTDQGNAFFSFDIALNEYYVNTIYSGRNAGVLLIHQGGPSGNNRKLGALKQSVMEKANENKYVAYIELKRFLHVKYRDIIGEYHDEFFAVDPIFGSRQLPSDEGMRTFSSHNEASRNGKSKRFEELTADYILNEGKSHAVMSGK